MSGSGRAEALFGIRAVLLGLIAAALLALLLLIGASAAPLVYDDIVRNNAIRSEMLAQLGTYIVFLGVFGTPVAIIATLVIGFPVWKLIERRGGATNRRVVIGGMASGALISALFTAYGVANGLSDYFDPTILGSTGGAHGLLTYNGLLTPLGWYYEARQLLIFAIAGACSGWVAFRVASTAGQRARDPRPNSLG